MNPELGTIRTVLIRSYDGLPYHLKSCFLYISIFPEDYRVGRRRLVRRWTAEGYSREVRGKFAEEILDNYFMELVRSMILPSQHATHSIKGIDSCQVHDLMREISISKSMEENLVFRLEEGCNLDSQAMVRHLAIGNKWKGGQSEFESIVDLSRLRSITVFGEWKPFYISDKMRLLRVVDLEDTTGLFDHHLDHIGKLIHLRYLSLRGCKEIYHLPDSFGNLKQLQTLDVRGTRIVRLPKTIIKLRKLRYLHAGMKSVGEAVSYGEFEDVVIPPVMKNTLCLLSICSALSCLFWCVPQLLPGDGMSRRDVCTAVCCYVVPAVVMQLDMYGVLMPRGMKKLKALRTLGVVNISLGKFILQDIKGLTQLRKLAVTGINKENGQVLCSATAALSRLESLSMRSEGEPGLCGCLDGMLSPPESLQSLKLYGNLVKLPEWIKELNNVVKLELRSTRISEPDSAMLVLGNLPNLASLHLLDNSFEQSKEFHFNFQPETFSSLVVLELDRIGDLASMKFDKAAVPKLEILKFYLKKLGSEWLSGLSSLSGLKQVLLEGSYTPSELKYLREELVLNQNQPILKRVYAPDDSASSTN